MPNTNSLEKLIFELKKLGSPKKAKASAWFFKTGKGQYGEGDKFLGITVPEQRRIARKYLDLKLTDILQLLKSPIHEHRFTALEILVFKFERASESEKTKIYNFYIKNSKLVNNWDLVDTSCRYIVGEYLVARPRNILYTFAKSTNIWQRRIAIVSTFAFLDRGEYTDTIKISEILLKDTHDLLQKAVGWLIREAGKRNEKVLKDFLKKHYKILPRTALRYAIEKFPKAVRDKYLKGEI